MRPLVLGTFRQATVFIPGSLFCLFEKRNTFRM